MMRARLVIDGEADPDGPMDVEIAYVEFSDDGKHDVYFVDALRASAVGPTNRPAIRLWMRPRIEGVAHVG